METTNKNLINTYFELFNSHQWEELGNMYSETAEFKDPSLGQGIVLQTREQFIAKYTELHSIFPDIHDKVLAMYPSGENHIIVEFLSTGKAEDGTPFELAICTIFTIENGKITKDFSYFDNFDENEDE